MEDIKEKEDEINTSLNENDIDFKTFLKYNNQILSYNPENIINKTNIEDLICSICYNILNNPISCSDKKNCHSFCKECIDIFLKENNKCPICKLIFEYKINNNLINELNNVSFKCSFKNEGCNEILFYSEYLNHYYNCKYNNIQYECNVNKYDYKTKKFKKCGYIGNKNEIGKHFKLCGLTEYICIFCQEKILKINIEEHFKNKCIFRIIHYNNGDIYMGEWKNNKIEGVGKYYFYNGTRYEGEWKNNKREGYGIFYYSNGNKLEGEWKNDIIEGIGILYNSKGGSIYEGEWKNNKLEGFGIFYCSDGDRYEGEWKNYKQEGFGIYYYSSGSRYEGEWKNNKQEGFGIFYYSDGDRYEGEWKNDKQEGFGIFYYSNGDRYEGEWKNDKREGFGIFYFLNGDIYKGEWKNGFSEGYGILYSSLGWKVQRYFSHNIKDIILFFIYKLILFLFNLYSTILRNKMTLLLIIILIIGILIK